MSGFAGFCTFPDSSPAATDLLARLQRALPSSSPLALAEGRAGLAAARWARSGDGRLTVAFDGAIYNRTTLRIGLTAADGDAELVLALYEQHGAACVEHLRGPYALAVWDERGADNPADAFLLLARDPMGLRALYYDHDEPGGRLRFATGVRPLAANNGASRPLDARGLYGFFRHGAVPEPFSMIAGVRALGTGERLVWRAGHLTRDRAAPPARPVLPTNDRETTKSLRAALLDSVGQHLADGVAAGVFVGGGVGSAALLALAREAGREKQLHALTIGFEGDAFDESDRARRTAEHFGVPHTHLRLDRDRARAWFDDFLPGLDQPGVHGFPLFALCRFAREEGIGVALAGIGVGEFFGDVRLHRELPRLMRWSQRLAFLRGPVGRKLLAAVSLPARQRLADFLTRPPTLAGAYAAVRGIHTAEEARALVARFDDPTGCAEPPPEEASAAGDFPTVDDEINALERRRRLREQLLRDADVFSRAHNLDLRLPFVDARIAGTIGQIPAVARLRGNRRLLRAAVPEMPPWVGAGAGSGLRFPAEAWRADEWGTAKPADTAGLRSRHSWEQRWSLFLFRRWRRQVNTG